MAAQPVEEKCMSTRTMSPGDAGKITRMLLEFDSLNQKRKLVNDLLASGVTLEMFQEFCTLQREVELGVPDYLRIDVQNMLSHLSKGIDVREDQILSRSKRQIVTLVQKAIQSQEMVLEAEQESKPCGPSN